MDGSTFTPTPATPIDLVVTLTTSPAPRVNKREASKAATRAKVVSAAAKLFADVGYEKATIRDIAKSATMSTGAVFANFEDKAALYTAIQGHAPVTTEQGLELFMLMRDLLPEIEAAITVRQSGGGGEPWAYLEALRQRASVVVEEIKATAPDMSPKP
ncbi:MAG: helix-turn-helix transcriptional regulator [Brevundimonas sp.]|nr:helix-turn-helix transcriptional regulator [Brevundimonas sp.]